MAWMTYPIVGVHNVEISTVKSSVSYLKSAVLLYSNTLKEIYIYIFKKKKHHHSAMLVGCYCSIFLKDAIG